MATSVSQLNPNDTQVLTKKEFLPNASLQSPNVTPLMPKSAAGQPFSENKTPPPVESHAAAGDADESLINKLAKQLSGPAKIIHDMKIIQGIWGALDAWIISYSTFKLFFDMVCPPGGSSSDNMHDFLMTKEGRAAGIIDWGVIVTLSVLGNTIDPDEIGYTLCQMERGTELDAKNNILYFDANKKKQPNELEKGKLYLEIIKGRLRYTVLKGKKIHQAFISQDELEKAHLARIKQEDKTKALKQEDTTQYFEQEDTTKDLKQEDKIKDAVSCAFKGPLSLAEFNPLLPDILSITQKNGHAKDQRKTLKSYLAWFWPYFRDMFKGMKFAYRGVRSTLLMAKMLGVDPFLNNAMGLSSILNVLMPTGLLLGVLAAMSRVWSRNIVSFRKEQKKINNNLMCDAQDIDGYDLVKMKDDGPYEKRKIYIAFGKGVLKYKVIDALGKVCDDSIPLTALKYQPVKDSQGNELEPPVEFFQEYYFPHILHHLADKKQVSINNNTTNRNKITAKINPQSQSAKRWGMVAAAYSGFIDGLYTYIGVIGLVATAGVSFPILFALSAACIIFTVACIINRCYEESDYQDDLIQTELNVTWTLLAKRLESKFFELQRIGEQEADNDIKDKKKGAESTNAEKLSKTKQQLIQGIDADLISFTIVSRRRQDLVAGSYKLAALAGLRAGLYAFSAISSIMWATASFCALALVAIPPAIVFTGVILGILSLAAGILHGCFQYSQYQKALKETLKAQETNSDKKKIQNGIEDLNSFYLGFKQNKIPLQTIDVKDAILNTMVTDPAPHFLFQEFFEWLRMIASGASKGNKATDYLLNSLQEQDSGGHYKDTPGMVRIGLVASLFYGVMYGLRGLSKNLRGENKRTPVTVKATPSKGTLQKSSANETMNLDNKKANPEDAANFSNKPKPTFERVALTREWRGLELVRFFPYKPAAKSPQTPGLTSQDKPIQTLPPSLKLPESEQPITPIPKTPPPTITPVPTLLLQPPTPTLTATLTPTSKSLASSAHLPAPLSLDNSTLPLPLVVPPSPNRPTPDANRPPTPWYARLGRAGIFGGPGFFQQIAAPKLASSPNPTPTPKSADTPKSAAAPKFPNI